MTSLMPLSIHVKQVSKGSMVIVVLLLLLVVGIFLFFPQPQPTIVGELPYHDIKQVTKLVRDQMRRAVLDDFAWRSLPSSLRGAWSDRILALDATSQGTVKIWTGTLRESQRGKGRIYAVNMGTNGWAITNIGAWIGSLSLTGKVATVGIESESKR